MFLLDQLAEARILNALEKGEFNNLPGEGKPLRLDDDSAVPEELRAAYRILKNAGFLPPELQARKELREAEQLLLRMPESMERIRAKAKLDLLRLRVSEYRGRSVNLMNEDQYYHSLIDHIEDRNKSKDNR